MIDLISQNRESETWQTWSIKMQNQKHDRHLSMCRICNMTDLVSKIQNQKHITWPNQSKCRISSMTWPDQSTCRMKYDLTWPDQLTYRMKYDMTWPDQSTYRMEYDMTRPVQIQNQEHDMTWPVKYRIRSLTWPVNIQNQKYMTWPGKILDLPWLFKRHSIHREHFVYIFTHRERTIKSSAAVCWFHSISVIFHKQNKFAAFQTNNIKLAIKYSAHKQSDHLKSASVSVHYREQALLEQQTHL